MDNPDALASSVWSELETLARPAREKRRLAPETRSRIIISLCGLAPLSVKELSQLLDRNEAYVGDAIRPLVNSGDLTFLYPDQPRHPKQKYLAVQAVALVAVPEPIGVRETAPVHVAPVPTRAPAVPPEPALTPEALAARGRFKPNQWTNLGTVVVLGTALSWLHAPLWALIGAVAGLGLAILHMKTNSPQYQRYRTLHPQNRQRRHVTFLLLKATVALAETALVFFVVRALHP